MAYIADEPQPQHIDLGYVAFRAFESTLNDDATAFGSTILNEDDTVLGWDQLDEVERVQWRMIADAVKMFLESRNVQ